MPALGEIAALGSALGWGIVTVVARRESRYVHILVYNTLRTALSALFQLLALLVLFLAGVYAPRFGANPWLGVALLAASVIMLVGIGDTLYFFAAQRIGVAKALPISMSSPLLTTLLAVLLLSEPFTLGLAGGMVLVPAGLYLVSMPGRGKVIGPEVDPAAARIGIAFALIAAVIWSFASIMVRPGLDQVDVLTATGLRSVVGAASVAALTIGSGRLRGKTGISGRRVGVAALSALLTAGSGLCFIVAIDLAGAARTTLLVTSAPLYAIPLSVWLLGEHVTPRVLLGTLLTVGGVMMVVSF